MKWQPVFVHPVSHVPLVAEANGFRCPQSGDTFSVHNEIPVFVPEALRGHMEEERQGLENTLKTLLRKSPLLYRFLIFMISPVCFSGLSAKRFLKRFEKDAKGLNVGSGIHKFGENILNIDIFYYEGVDVVANGEQLPFADESIDAVICESLLEHVPRPNVIVDDMFRVLKKGGEMYVVIPFVYPFHACPNDFYRWSQTGIQHLLKQGEIVEVGVRAGPSSALMGQLTTWTAIVLSFGITPLYNLLTILLPLIFFPIKFLDILFGRYPTAIHGAGQFYAVAKKR